MLLICMSYPVYTDVYFDTIDGTVLILDSVLWVETAYVGGKFDAFFNVFFCILGVFLGDLGFWGGGSPRRELEITLSMERFDVYIIHDVPFFGVALSLSLFNVASLEDAYLYICDPVISKI